MQAGIIIMQKTCVLLFFITILALSPNANGDDLSSIETQLGEMFHKTMKKWQMSYTVQETTKAGVACVPWDRLDLELLSTGIFEAIGFSYSMATEDAAIRVATQGCQQMAQHYQVVDCSCDVIFVNENVVVSLPDDFSLSQQDQK